ncbi:MAG: C2H2-type zinc finger protein [Thaumarchaeota archaeon]|nr:C2H2-type zinc finger protein [Nitrososphaerota archaeon]
MITVNCNDVLPIQHELLVFVSDQIGAIPTLKHHEFVLSPIENDDEIDKKQVTASIKEYLDSIGEVNNFGVIADSDTILIKSINGKKINKVIQPVQSLRSCCGF